MPSTDESDTDEPAAYIEMVCQQRGLRSVAKSKRWLTRWFSDEN